MEKRIREIALFVFLTVFAWESYISCIEISSQIVFDSQENERDPNDFYSKDSLNLNQVNDRLATTRRIPKSFIFAINSENAFRMSNKKRSHFIQDDPTRQPAVINNIQIIVNENGTKSGIDVCKNGICNISVSSRLNNEGNIVTDVHLTVITKLETDFKTNDIPIVDGVRGVANTYDLGLRHLNRSRPSTYLYNTPQIQSRYQGGEPWYQGRRSFQRPRIKPVVDDKIEPPLSKTQWNKE
ncbi:uncharacterized protein LOC126867120 isoform X2 [Bombus huntii]|uniref:uncharacterized protein LOC126867120 isoform X2 n=1 Tax=Bombus huntii TaxID=85661 RepID=UPI0021AA0198|nr:uncharacterized protein LOC126867120 isoform X2 [Bombus huntii]